VLSCALGPWRHKCVRACTIVSKRAAATCTLLLDSLLRGPGKESSTTLACLETLLERWQGPGSPKAVMFIK
jgi:hypothetical protein